MDLNELSFSFSAVQWLVTIAIGVYSWVISRQSATNQEVLELRTRVVTLEERVAQLPTQQQLSELLVQLSRVDSQLSSIHSHVQAQARRLERIDDYLLKLSGGGGA